MTTAHRLPLKRKQGHWIAIGLRISIILILASLPTSSLAAAQSPAEMELPFFYSWLSQDAVPGPGRPPALPIRERLASNTPAAEPLPTDCGEFAALGEAPPGSCVYGYVYRDGKPVPGVTVTVSGDFGDLTAVTQSGPLSAHPYFAVWLRPPPIAAEFGNVARASAAVAEETNATTFTVQGGAQQVDIWLSSSCGPTYVGGVIASDTTWTGECSPYIVVENILLVAGYTLEIQPGTIVRFQPGKSLRTDGELKVLGLPSAMVRMTSDATPAPGAWGYVLFAPSCVNASYDINGQYLDGSIMLDTLIEYAGGAVDADNAALRLDNCSPYLRRTHVRQSAGDGVRIYDGSMLVMLESSVRESAGWAIYNRSNAAQMLVAYSELANNGLGGVYSTNGTELWVSNNRILDNLGNFGVYIIQGSGVIGNNWIAGNKGGVRLERASDLHHNVIIGNQGGAGIRTSTYTMNINHNLILENNNSAGNGGGLYISSGASNVHNNVFIGNQAKVGGGAYMAGGTSFLHNTVLSNRTSDQGSGLYVNNSSATLQFNTLLGNQSGARLGGVYFKNYPAFTDNNLYGNASYDLYNGNLASGNDLKAELNWWGTAETAAILALIWDYLDDSTLSLVDFNPSLASAQQSAPIAPPTGLQVQRSGSSLELSWNENAELDTAGYRIYYDTDGAGFPYNGTGLSQGSAPIDVGDVLSYTLTSVPDGMYYFAVTAYDSDQDGKDDQTEGNESWFSEDVAVTVGQAPAAGFSAAPTSGIRPLTVNFTNQSSGNIASCSWNFGDGSGSDSCGNPSHTYTQAGSFTVSLTVTGPAGSDSEVKTGYITVSPVPVHADFSAVPRSGVRPLEVHFTNLSDGDYTTCAWTFGDGAASAICGNPVHTYAQAGSYPVSLTLNGPGGSATEVKAGYITVSPVLVHADFSAVPRSGVRPLEVHFTNLSSGDYTACVWDFGDGATSANCGNPVHTYASAGVYTVTLTINGPGGTDTHSQADLITIQEEHRSYLPLILR